MLLDHAFRKRCTVKNTVKGRAVTTVDPGSPAADKLKAVKDAGKKTALLLVSNAGGDVRYVALSVN